MMKCMKVECRIKRIRKRMLQKLQIMLNKY